MTHGGLHFPSFSRVRQRPHLVHTSALSNATVTATASQSTLPGSRAGTPPRDAGTPNSGMNKDGTVLLDCVGCGRPVRSTCFSPSPTLPNVVVLSFTIILRVDGF
jgi:hypothetical protein